jgi:hypothetical protein
MTKGSNSWRACQGQSKDIASVETGAAEQWSKNGTDGIEKEKRRRCSKILIALLNRRER